MESRVPDSPQLHGVVIITLPPADNPSLGKTITAFTLSDHDHDHDDHVNNHNNPSSLSHDDHVNNHNNPSSLSPVQQNPLQSQTHIPVLRVLTFVCVSLVVFALSSSLLSSSIQQLNSSNNNNDSNDDRDTPDSFLFPLFHKFSGVEVSRRDIVRNVERLSVDSSDNAIVLRGAGRLGFLKSDVNVSSSIFPVRGNVFPDGLYYTLLQVGNPPRPYYLDVDTGSDLTWIQCDAPCSSCAKGANALYRPRRGNIVPPKDSLCMEVQKNQKTCGSCQQCDYEIEYADHSSSMGVLASDELHLSKANGSSAKSNFIFGCAYDQQGTLLDTLAKTDGILGLSRARISLPSQLAMQGIIKNVVGHCLSADASGGGYVFLGDDFVPHRGMAWVPMIDNPSTNFYPTELVKLYYGSSMLSLGGQDGRVRQIVFDSGSSYTYFPKEAYSELVASLKEVSRTGLSQDTSDTTLPICWRAPHPIRSVKDVKQYFKTLSIQFGSKWWIISTKFKIPPEGYLIVSKKDNVCLGILDGSNVHDGSAFILGDISLRGQLVVYDNVGKKIGWMSSDCAKPRRFESPPFVDGF